LLTERHYLDFTVNDTLHHQCVNSYTCNPYLFVPDEFQQLIYFTNGTMQMAATRNYTNTYYGLMNIFWIWGPIYKIS